MVSARVLATLALSALLITSAVTASATSVHAQGGDLSDDEEDDDVSEENESDETDTPELGEEALDRVDDDVRRRQHGTNVHEIVAELEGGSGTHEALPEGFRTDLADVLDRYDDRQGTGWTDKLAGDLQGLLEKYQDDFAEKFGTDDGLPMTEVPDGEMSETELQNEASNRGHAMSGIDWGASVRIKWGGGNGPAVDVKVHAGGKSTPWIGHNDPTEDVKKELNDIVQGEDEDVSTEGVEDFDPEEKEDSGKKQETDEKTHGDEDETGTTDEGESTPDEKEEQKDAEDQQGEGEKETNDGDSENDESGDSNESGGTEESEAGSESDESDGEGESGPNGESGEGEQKGDAKDGTDSESGKKGMPSSPVGPGGGTGCGKTMMCDQDTGNIDFNTDSGNDVAEECKAMMPTKPGEDCKRPGENDGKQPAEVGNDQHEQCKYMNPTGPGEGCDFDGASAPSQDATNIESQCKYMSPQQRRNCDDLSWPSKGSDGSVKPGGGNAQAGGKELSPPG